jgi:hypothetical protein
VISKKFPLISGKTSYLASKKTVSTEGPKVVMAVLIAPQCLERKLGSLIKDFLALSSPVFRTHFLGHRSPLSCDRLGASIAGCVNPCG